MSQNGMIRTKIKFNRSTKNEETLVGYVTKNEKGVFRGCREDDQVKKKIVIPDEFLARGMKEGVLYDCELKPMKNGAGFIAVTANVTLFPAVVDTTVTNNRFKVEVKFGNKRIVFDPQYGNDPCRKTVNGVLEILNQREDIRDKEQVIDAFLRSANMVDALYKDYRNHQL